MEQFRNRPMEGNWWPPEDPSNVFEGALTVDNTNAGNIILKGKHRDTLTFLKDGPRTIHGRLESGHEMTLFDCVTRALSWRAISETERKGKAELFTNEILVGAHVARADTPAFLGVRFSISGLEEWCDDSGFLGELEDPVASPGAERVRVFFTGSVSPAYLLGEGRSLRLMSTYQGPIFFPSQKSVSMREQNIIELSFEHTLSVKDVFHEIGVWRNFLALALRRPSHLQEVDVNVAARGDCPIWFPLLARGRQKEASPTPRHPSELLLTKSKLGAEFHKYLIAWWQRYQIFEIPVMLYTGTLYQNDLYSHTNLLAYLQALEILHRESTDVSRFPDADVRRRTIEALRAAIPDDLDEELRRNICQQLGFIGEVSLLDRLKSLFNSYPETLRTLFPAGEADLKLLRDVRNYLTHYKSTRSFNRRFLQSRQLAVQSEKVRLFVEVCLLGLLGMNDMDVMKFMCEFEPFVQWRYVQHS